MSKIITAVWIIHPLTEKQKRLRPETNDEQLATRHQRCHDTSKFLNKIITKYVSCFGFVYKNKPNISDTTGLFGRADVSFALIT